VIYILLEYLSRQFLSRLELEDTKPHKNISAVAGIIDGVVQNDQGRKTHLLNWCCSPSGAGLGDGVGIRRAVVAVLAKDRDMITSLLEKSLNQFGDKLYIKHTAVLQQEGKDMQTILPQSADTLTAMQPMFKYCYSVPVTSQNSLP
jgi:telomere length regulation protein